MRIQPIDLSARRNAQMGIKMEFPSSYFEGEEREGFYVQPLIKKAWAAQIEVLLVIDEICKRHDIQYFAEWGTLLGAIRHKGYIPWDDDLDIGMMRKDFVRFLHYAKEEVPKGYVVLDADDDRNDELLARVMNSDRILPNNKEFLEKFHGCPYGIGVDIFCWDNVPKSKEEERSLLIMLQAANVLAGKWDSEEEPLEDKMETLRQLEEVTGFHFDMNASVKKQLLQFSHVISAAYFDTEPDEVAIMCHLVDFPDWRLPASCFESMIEVPFENITIPIPVGYERLVKLRYGENYMTPVKSWGTHPYPYFIDQIEKLREFCRSNGEELPACFDMEFND